MPNVLSTIGYGLQGVHEAQMDDAQVARQAQLGSLTDQQIKAGAMGLEDLTRTRANAATERSAVAGAGNLAGGYDAAAKARLAAGDVAGATEATAGNRAVIEQSLKQLLIDTERGMGQQGWERYKAATGQGADLPNPGFYVAPQANDPAFKQIQATHPDAQPGDKFIAMPDKSGNVNMLNVSGTIRAAQKTEIHPGGAAGTFVVQGGKTTAIPPMAPPNTNWQQGVEKRTRKDAEGNEVTQLIDVRQTLPGGQPNPNYGKEIGGDAGGMPGGPGGTNVRKDLSVLNDITKGITELGEEYGKTDMSNPLNPKITLTPKGQQVALIAEQIRLANQNLAPRTIIELAVKGKPMWKNEDGKRTGVVLYNNQEFPMATPSGKVPEQPKPAASPAPAVSPTAPAAAAQPPIPTIQDAGAMEQPQPAQPIQTRTAQPAANTRHYDMQLEAKSPELKRMGNLLRLKPVGQVDVNTWIEYANLAKKLGGRGFAKGGKVSGRQSHGLG